MGLNLGECVKDEPSAFPSINDLVKVILEHFKIWSVIVIPLVGMDLWARYNRYNKDICLGESWVTHFGQIMSDLHLLTFWQIQSICQPKAVLGPTLLIHTSLFCALELDISIYLWFTWSKKDIVACQRGGFPANPLINTPLWQYPWKNFSLKKCTFLRV